MLTVVEISDRFRLYLYGKPLLLHSYHEVLKTAPEIKQTRGVTDSTNHSHVALK